MKSITARLSRVVPIIALLTLVAASGCTGVLKPSPEKEVRRITAGNYWTIDSGDHAIAEGGATALCNSGGTVEIMPNSNVHARSGCNVILRKGVVVAARDNFITTTHAGTVIYAFSGSLVRYNIGSNLETRFDLYTDRSVPDANVTLYLQKDVRIYAGSGVRILAFRGSEITGVDSLVIAFKGSFPTAAQNESAPALFARRTGN